MWPVAFYSFGFFCLSFEGTPACCVCQFLQQHLYIFSLLMLCWKTIHTSLSFALCYVGDVSSSISNSMAHLLVSFSMLVQLCVLMSTSSLEYTSCKISVRACMLSCCADRVTPCILRARLGLCSAICLYILILVSFHSSYIWQTCQTSGIGLPWWSHLFDRYLIRTETYDDGIDWQSISCTEDVLLRVGYTCVVSTSLVLLFVTALFFVFFVPWSLY